jgi:hypothetical protein
MCLSVITLCLRLSHRPRVGWLRALVMQKVASFPLSMGGPCEVGKLTRVADTGSGRRAMLAALPIALPDKIDQRFLIDLMDFFSTPLRALLTRFSAPSAPSPWVPGSAIFFEGLVLRAIFRMSEMEISPLLKPKRRAEHLNRTQ